MDAEKIAMRVARRWVAYHIDRYIMIPGYIGLELLMWWSETVNGDAHDEASFHDTEHDPHGDEASVGGDGGGADGH